MALCVTDNGINSEEINAFYEDNDIDFIFRRHQENLKLNINTNTQTIENFNEF